MELNTQRWPHWKARRRRRQCVGPSDG